MHTIFLAERGPTARRRVSGLPAVTVAALLAATAPAALAAPVAPAPSASLPASGCDLDYRITPRPDLQPAAIEVELRFAAGGRRESVLRAVPSWGGVTDFAASYADWAALAPGQDVQPMAEPYRWQVRHGPDDVVHVRWRVRTALADPEAEVAQSQLQLYRTQVGARGFQFFGHGALASVEHWGDDTAPALCLSLQPFDAASAVFGSLGRAGVGAAMHWRATGSPGMLRHAFYGGGPMWRLQERTVHGGTLSLAARGRFAGLRDAEFADAAARLIDMQRRFWDGMPSSGAAPTPDPSSQWLVLTPNHVPSGNSGGTLVRHAAVLHAPQDFSARSSTFEFLVAHENLHQWFPGRFGGHGREGPVKDAEHYWFSEGFTDHYTHRLLLASGLWSLQDYAARLTERARRYLGSPARTLKAEAIAPRFFSDREAGQQMYLRGEWLALRWDAALRRAGRGSLTTQLQALMQPASAQGEGAGEPASRRVLAALTAALAGTGTDPRDDVQRHVVGGEPMPLDGASWHDAAGPCLVRDEVEVPVWTLGFDGASFQEYRLKGVDPQGPAYAAGLRDGMSLAGFSVYGGDVGRDAVIQIREAAYGETPAAVRTVTYRPLSSQRQRLPRWQARDGAVAEAACAAWIAAR